MKTNLLILATAIFCASCARQFKARAPNDFVWHTVAAQEDLGMIALRYYDDPKAGFIYLQEVNHERLILGQPEPGQAAPGTRLMVPSKADFAQWMRDETRFRGLPELSQKLNHPEDWGPAYVPGIENGPPSSEHSIAAEKAEVFLAKQTFAAQFAKRACRIGGADCIDVSFALLSDPTGHTRGIVRVNMKTGECSWLGVHEVASRTPIFVTLPANGVVAATPQQQTFLKRLESLWLHASREEVEILLGKANQATATNLVYCLYEDPTTVGYYIGATLTFTAQGLEQVQVYSGQETRNRQRKVKQE